MSAGAGTQNVAPKPGLGFLDGSGVLTNGKCEFGVLELVSVVDNHEYIFDRILSV